MKTRAFWIVSLVSALVAICLHLAALGKAGNGVRSISQAMNANAPEDQRQKLKVEAHQFYKVASNFRFTGIAVAILSVIFLFLSYKKDEQATRSVTIAILAFYLLLQFAVV